MRLVQSLALAAVAIAPVGAAAQSCCGQPTVAYAPVVPQVAAAPVVQQTTVRDGWYPGKYLTDFTRNIFGLNRTTTTYTAGYAPYTAGYAPYTANFAPTFATRTAYRPVYPATWGPVAPFTQTVSRPVVLSPVVAAPACGPCNTCVASPCDCCGGSCPGGSCASCGVAQAGFNAPQSFQQEPRLAPSDDVPPVRDERSIRQRQDLDFPPLPEDLESDRTQGEPAASQGYWGAPPLFAPPTNRVTRNTHPAPVRTAVYNRAPEVRQTAYRPATPSTGKVTRLSDSGWVAAE